MNALAAWRHVLLAPWQRQRNRASWTTLSIIVVLSLTPAVGGWVLHQPKIVLVGAATGVALSAAAAWLMVLINLVTQNQPAAARLVPAHPRRLREVLFGAWLALSLLVASVFGAAVGGWLVWWLGTGTALLLVGWMLRRPMFGALLWTLAMFNELWTDLPVVRALWHALRHAIDAAPVGVVLALIAGALLSARAWLLDGGTRHARRYAVSQRWHAAMRDMHTGRQRVPPGVAGALTLAANRLYDRWMARLVASPHARDAGARGLLVLGPQAHWTGHAGRLLVFGAPSLVVIVLLSFIELAPGVSWGETFFAGAAIGVLMFTVGQVVSMCAALCATRREQALVMLAPGMPQGTALNRLLAQHMLLQFVGLYGVALLIGGVLVHFAAPVRQITTVVSVFPYLAIACVPIGVLQWTDWSRARPMGPGRVAAVTLVPVLLTAGLLGLHAWFGLGLIPMAATVGAVTLALGTLRWRTMRSAPSAFPVGRRSG